MSSLTTLFILALKRQGFFNLHDAPKHTLQKTLDSGAIYVMELF